jgi:IS1 family transposase
LETHGTIFHGTQASVELIVRVLACLAEGLGIRSTARVFEVDPNTVLGWLVEAADQLQAFSTYFLHDLPISQVQLDELYAVLHAVKDGTVSEAEAIERLERSSHWVWVAMDPESKGLLTMDVGERTLAMAQRMVHQVVQVLAPGCVPLFLTDGLREYMTALLAHYGHWMHPERRQATGPLPKPCARSSKANACTPSLTPSPLPLPPSASGSIALPTMAHRVESISRALVDRPKSPARWHSTSIALLIKTPCRMALFLRNGVAAHWPPCSPSKPGSSLAVRASAAPEKKGRKLRPPHRAPGPHSG